MCIHYTASKFQGGKDMGNKPSGRHYFAEGITNRGYISLLPNMMSEWERTYVLMGGPGTGKSTTIKMIGLDLLDRGYEVDFLRSARDPDSMAGVLIRRFNWAILDHYEIAPLHWRAPGVIEHFVDFSKYCNQGKLEQQRLRVLELGEKIKRGQQRIGEILAEEFGGRIRERFYAKADEGRPWLPKLYASDLFKEAKGPWSKAQDALKKIQKSAVQSFFLHGINPEGWLNLAPYFLTDYDQIRFDGEEAHEAMEWVLQEAEQLGQVIDIVLHPLYPDEILGIVFPERNLAIWQGDPEHLEDQGLGCPFSNDLKKALLDTQRLRDKLKAIYTKTVDFDQVDSMKTDLLNSILRDMDKKVHTID
ncbi:PRK06851 family protein [Desulfitobacterium hafniense]|nr:PRK06851 family protein [Desulfitobacterium hafniense]